MTKMCSVCERTLPATQKFFKPHKQCRDGLLGQCRECRNRYVQEWKQRNREHYLAKKQEYYENHKGQYQEYDSRRKALVRGTRETERLDYLGILERDGLWCYLCETEVDPDHVSYDHVIPLSRGGTHTVDNIRVTHRRCNLSKNAKTPAEYLRGD